MSVKGEMARLEGLEPPTPRSEVWCSDPLSYRRAGALILLRRGAGVNFARRPGKRPAAGQRGVGRRGREVKAQTRQEVAAIAADWARIGLWVGTREARVQGVCSASPGYVREILEHAGICYVEPAREALARGEAAQAILLFVGNVSLSPLEQAAVQAHVTAGGAAVFVAYHSEAAELLGVAPVPPPLYCGSGFVPLGEGYLEAGTHPVAAGVPRPLHYFGGVAVSAPQAQVLATGADCLGRPDSRPLVTERRLGRGLALLIAPDLPGTVARLQQGSSVQSDRPSAADGTINTGDGILKCDDGCQLHYVLDRDLPPGEEMACFATPVADRWREVLIRALLHAAGACRVPLPMLWYYPRSLPALGMLSFDSDGNDRALAETHLANLRRFGVRGTWAVMEPGYDQDFLRQLREAGMEVGLHYNALDPPDAPTWSRAAFARQLKLLADRLGGRPVVSNKNHYTRWEGCLEFFRWCQDAGMLIEESRGPSKSGAIGFPFGTCHPWFPMTEEGERLGVLEIGFLTQDLVVTAPASFARLLPTWASEVHGVAHLLFHPAHCTKPGVAESLEAFISHARGLGMEFWTDAEIHAWEIGRRSVQVASGEGRFTLSTQAPLAQATVLSLLPPGEEDRGEVVERYGCRFGVRLVDLEPGRPVELAALP